MIHFKINQSTIDEIEQGTKITFFYQAIESSAFVNLTEIYFQHWSSTESSYVKVEEKEPSIIDKMREDAKWWSKLDEEKKDRFHLG